LTNTWREEWLASVDEPVLDPDQVIVDAHQHLWDRGSRHAPYVAADLAADALSGHRVVQTVHIQRRSPRIAGPEVNTPEAQENFVVEETEFVVTQARDLDRLTGGRVRLDGIVAFVDLMNAERVERALDAHEAAGAGLVRGIRYGAAYDADPELAEGSRPAPDLYADPAFREGFAIFAGRGWAFDAYVYHPQIGGVTELARAFPGATIVLDHTGTPLGVGSYARDPQAVLASWRDAIAALAREANVVLKLGGMAMERNGFGWHLQPKPPTSDQLAASQRPFFDHAISCFGPSRCMIGSNFPIEKNATSYKILWNAYKKLARSLSEDERNQLFHQTARRAYRLPAVSPAL
jgi:L-fuconolactonase